MPGQKHSRIIDGIPTYWVTENGCLCRMLTAADDTDHDPHPYDPQCGLCYLGYGHSAAYHNANVRVAQRTRMSGYTGIAAS